MKFQVIVCDPPWSTQDALSMSTTKRGAAANYPVMTIDDICALPVNDLADSNGCVLALWVLGSMLEDGLKVMKAWGFKQKQVFVWVKSKKQESLSNEMRRNVVELAKKVGRRVLKLDGTPVTFRDFDFILDATMLAFGMGRLFRQSHEICLIGVNNTKVYSKLDNKSQRSVCFAENIGHSIKPENLQDSLDIMFPNTNKLEMFARRKRLNWTTIGYDVSNGEDIKTSLDRLSDD